MFSVSGRMSTNTGLAPRRTNALTVETKVNDGHDHLVARPQVEQQRRHLERVRARRGEQRLRRAGNLLEAARDSALVNGPSPEIVPCGDRRAHVVELAPGDGGAVERNRCSLARSLTIARVSRSTSRCRIVSRLSCACLPLASASATLTRPFLK